MRNNYLSDTQKTAVEARIKDGYDCEQLTNGNYLCIKGRHTMEINQQGYDVYIRPSFVR